MDLPKNAFKAAIRAGKPQIGLWSAIGVPSVAEMLAACGFDWILFDCEHAPIGTLDVLPLLQAVAPYPVSPIVRPTSLDPAENKRLLDFGAQTLLVPYLRSVEEVRLAAASVAYPPAGIRGLASTTRASRFGAIAGYHRQAREEICLLIQIETLSALEALDEILEVEGVDGVFVGPADLAASLGYTGETSHPEVRKVCVDIVKRVRAAGLPAGFLALDPKFLEEIVDAGSVFTAVDIDTAILRRGAVAQAEHWRGRQQRPL